jgi:hypothetical protein
VFRPNFQEKEQQRVRAMQRVREAGTSEQLVKTPRAARAAALLLESFWAQEAFPPSLRDADTWFQAHRAELLLALRQRWEGVRGPTTLSTASALDGAADADPLSGSADDLGDTTRSAAIGGRRRSFSTTLRSAVAAASASSIKLDFLSSAEQSVEAVGAALSSAGPHTANGAESERDEDLLSGTARPSEGGDDRSSQSDAVPFDDEAEGDGVPCDDDDDDDDDVMVLTFDESKGGGGHCSGWESAGDEEEGSEAGEGGGNAERLSFGESNSTDSDHGGDNDAAGHGAAGAPPHRKRNPVELLRAAAQRYYTWWDSLSRVDAAAITGVAEIHGCDDGMRTVGRGTTTTEGSNQAREPDELGPSVQTLFDAPYTTAADADSLLEAYATLDTADAVAIPGCWQAVVPHLLQRCTGGGPSPSSEVAAAAGSSSSFARPDHALRALGLMFEDTAADGRAAIFRCWPRLLGCIAPPATAERVVAIWEVMAREMPADVLVVVSRDAAAALATCAFEFAAHAGALHIEVSDSWQHAWRATFPGRLALASVVPALRLTEPSIIQHDAQATPHDGRTTLHEACTRFAHVPLSALARMVHDSISGHHVVVPDNAHARLASAAKAAAASRRESDTTGSERDYVSEEVKHQGAASAPPATLLGASMGDDAALSYSPSAGSGGVVPSATPAVVLLTRPSSAPDARPQPPPPPTAPNSRRPSATGGSGGSGSAGCGTPTNQQQQQRQLPHTPGGTTQRCQAFFLVPSPPSGPVTPGGGVFGAAPLLASQLPLPMGLPPPSAAPAGALPHTARRVSVPRAALPLLLPPSADEPTRWAVSEQGATPAGPLAFPAGALSDSSEADCIALCGALRGNTNENARAVVAAAACLLIPRRSGLAGTTSPL